MFISLQSLLGSVFLRLNRENGQTMAEYGVLVAAIAIVVLAVAFIFGGQISSVFTNAGSHL